MIDKAGQKVGVIVGRGKNPDEVQMVVAFSEREKAPKLGTFIVVEEQEFMKRKLLSRVEDMSYGDFQTTTGERQRALVEKYLRDIAGHGRELSEEEKRGLFFREYVLKVLGEITDDEIETGGKKAKNQKIVAEYRLLPELSSICRFPSECEYQTISSAGLQDPTKAIAVGKLAFGTDRVDKINVLFEPSKFEKRRTAIFARTGYGKSNLCKIVVSLASLASKAGILILDIDGEYAFGTKDTTGKNVPGLADIDAIKGNLAVYTNRRDVLNQYKDVFISPFLNLEYVTPRQVAELFRESAQDSATVETFRQSPKARSNWGPLIKELRGKKYWERENALSAYAKEVIPGTANKVGMQALLGRQLNRVFDLDNPRAANTLWEIMYFLARGRIVVLDLSLFETDQAIGVAALILGEIFNRNIREITSGKVINTVAVFEEAQNVLNREALKEGRSVFVRWAKEGRKFQLGLIYVTQQPGAIAEEIVSQTDNYFVMHLLNKGDIDSLVNANRHYGGVISEFLGDETIIGNAYVYSAPYQPYIFPANVHEFDQTFIDAFMTGPSKKPTLGTIKQEFQEVANVLSPIFARSDNREPKKIVGGAGIELYKFYNDKNVLLPFMDHEKKWLDYRFTQDLIYELAARNLVRIPQPLKRDDVEPGEERVEEQEESESEIQQ